MTQSSNNMKEFLLKHSVLFFFFVVIVFTAITAYKIIEFPYFFFSDQTFHLDVIRGDWGPLFYPIGGGRFFPLAFLEFYLILRSGMSIENIMFSMYAVEAAKFVLFSLSFFYLLKLCSHSWLLAFIGFAPFFYFAKNFDLIGIFAHTIFPESMLLLLLALFFIFYFQAKSTDKLAYYLCAILVMTYTLYLKEPVFASFMVFAFMRLVFFRKEIGRREKYFQYVVALNCVAFLCLYFLLAYTSGGTYNGGRVQGDYFEFLDIIFMQYGFILPVIIACIRCAFVFFGKRKVILADVFLLMSLAYVFCFVILFLNASYYFLPAYFLLWIAYVLYATQFLESFGERLKKFFYFPVLLLLVLFLSVLVIREPIRRAGSFGNSFKIFSNQSLNLLQKIREQRKLAFYLLSPNEYKIPFHHEQDGWVFHIISNLDAFFQGLTQADSIKKISLPEFIRFIDAGNIGLVSSVNPQPSALFRESYPQYELLPFGMSYLVIHKESLMSVLPLYNDFVKKMLDEGMENDYYYVDIILEKMKELGYDLSQ